MAESSRGLLPGAIRSVLDSRGQLVAVEHDLLPFRPVRSFVVTSEAAPVDRGGHAASCRELIVLVHGRARVSLRDSAGTTIRAELGEPGDALLVAAGDHVDYSLEQPGSALLVLADQPFDASSAGRR